MTATRTHVRSSADLESRAELIRKQMVNAQLSVALSRTLNSITVMGFDDSAKVLTYNVVPHGVRGINPEQIGFRTRADIAAGNIAEELALLDLFYDKQRRMYC